MNKILTIFLLLFLCIPVLSQLSDYSDFQSVLRQVPIFQTSPAGTQSMMITNPEGFDNFHLGTDFGEPHIATNPRDPLNSICAYNINSLYYTIDGINWTKVIVSFPGFGVLGDPVLAFDSLGNAYYSTLYQNGGTYGIAVAKSSNKGASWFQFTSAASTIVGLSDKEWIVADQSGGPYSNRVYIGWRQFGSSDMRFVFSSNGGLNWSAPQTHIGSQGAYVAVGPNGNIPGGSVYLTAIGGGGFMFYRSTNGGVSFSDSTIAGYYTNPGIQCAERTTVKGCIRIDPFPRMAVDNSFNSSRGNVYIAYASNPPGIDIADVYLLRSTNYGLNWSLPIKINDDATTTDQFMPAISVDNITGKIFVSWYDSRVDPANNIMTQMYGAVSTNGGVSFEPNYKISDVPFNPDNMRQNQGTHYYIGDYHGISAIRNTSYIAWMDARFNSLSSFVGYYPDYAMQLNTTLKNIGNNDSTNVTVKIPALKGNYTGRVKFTVVLDSTPASGIINFSFQNGKDSITNFPDSVILKIKTIGTVTPRLYKVKITGRGPGGVPVHERLLDLYVNTSLLIVGTNRPSIAEFKVNGVQYNTTQQLVIVNGSSVTIQAISPKVVGVNRYVFLNWSNGGDTSQTITINNNLTLFATYKVQYKLNISSSIGNTFGGNIFYDSASQFIFGVLSKYKDTLGVTYRFRGWNGLGNGSYTSPDSSGNDTAVTLSMNNSVLETARWESLIGVNNISNEIPKAYKLYQNYPNPFNPVTSINFDIIRNENVKIMIYDLLGRQVAVLADEILKPGRYNIIYNAVNLASGVYYYRIETSSFVDIKKMILIK